MKYPEQHKQEVSQRLRQQAARLLREKGVDGISVKSVMASEGMTVGGFYAHFDSKQALLVEAIKSAFKDSEQRFYPLLDNAPAKDWIPNLLRLYLSEMHRDNVEHACPISSLMGDIARSDPKIRRVFQEGMEYMLDLYTRRVSELGDDEARQVAMGLVSLMAGGIQLSRAVADEKYSAEILQSCIASAEVMLRNYQSAPS
jgi:TetR/AcrR family transcriptional repressor of nem operon